MKNKKGFFVLSMLFMLSIPLPLSALMTVSPMAPLEMDLEVTFEATATYPTNVVINEVLFNDILPNDVGEFTELYNPTENSIDMSFWRITDEESTGSEGTYEFPNGTIIQSRGFIIIFNDIDPAQLITPDDVSTTSLVQLFETKTSENEPDEDNRVENLTRVAGTAEYQLANSGDQIFLYNNIMTLVDSVSYAPSSPWTTGVATENRLLTPGDWTQKSFSRVWSDTSSGWNKDGYGNAIKMTPSPGKLDGNDPSYGDEDPFGDGIPDNVVINEVFFGPMQQDAWASTSSGRGTLQWQFNQFIEIYNPTDENVEVTDWTIETNANTWIFLEGKHADELGDSDMLVLWPDRNDEAENETYMEPDDNYSPWWQWWNNVDKMEFWYGTADFNWWWDVKDDNYPSDPDYGQEYRLALSSGPTQEFELNANGDFVILRNETGGLVDVVCWGTGLSLLNAKYPAIAAVVGDQNAGTNNGIGEWESLERVWQDHYPVADFNYGPGVFHLPTPGKVVGDVPDEIADETHSADWEELDVGEESRGNCDLGIILDMTIVEKASISVDKWMVNPKDHLDTGNVTNVDGINFWRIMSNASISNITATICYGQPPYTNESTFELYVWDHENEEWDLITADHNMILHTITGTADLNATISETMWLGIFGESTNPFADIPSFNPMFVILGLLSIIVILVRQKKRELKIL
jgi:hypothetical protein